MGRRAYLRSERARPLLRPGLRGGEGSYLPVRDLASPGDRNDGGGVRPPRADARYRHSALHVPRRSDARVEPLPPARPRDRRGLRRRSERAGRGNGARYLPRADRAEDARPALAALDTGGRDLAPSRPARQRRGGAPDGTGRRRARGSEGEADQLVSPGRSETRPRREGEREAALL